MTTIAIIGAGSIVFCKTLVQDIIASGMTNIEFRLMAPSTSKTKQVRDYVQQLIDKHDLNFKVSLTTHRREAVDGADYVISTFQIGGLEATKYDYQIPLKHGVDQCIGDTLGPGGIFRALRSIPVTMGLARDMEELCPNATLLNYVNPMAMVCWALGQSSINFVGLCHGTQITLDLIAGYIGVPKSDIDFLSAGINHMAWFLKLERDGRNLYPILRERFERPEYYINEKVRGEVFRHFGYFMTESTGHLSEYLPYFRKSQESKDEYCDEPAFGGESGAHYKWAKVVTQKYSEGSILDGEPLDFPERSIEYGSHIIEALETEKTFTFQGNVINRGMIANLPSDCCAEGPMVADRNGLRQTIVGDLPPQCAALNLTNINVQRLAVHAGIQGDTESLVHACALDPLTSAVLTLREIREMVTEMLEAERKWLPQFEGKEVKPTPRINIPKDVRRADVPVDPALAIAQRFGELMQ